MESGEIAAQFYTFNEEHKKHKFNYCDKSFVKNVTRMTKHTASCKSAPFQVHDVAVSAVSKMESKRRKKEASLENQENLNHSLIEATKSDTSILTAAGEAEKIRFWKIYIRALLSSGAPLSCNENAEWKLLFQSWKSHLPLPSQHDLVEGILNEEYESVKIEVEERISGCSFYALKVDSNDKEVLLFVSISETFLYAAYSKNSNDGGKSLFTKVKTALSELGREKCGAIVVNVDLVISDFWRLLSGFIEKEKLLVALYPSAVEALNSLLKEIFNLPSYLHNKRSLDSFFRCIETDENIEAQVLSETKQLLGNESALKHPFCVDKNTIDCINDLKKLLQYLAVTFENEIFTTEIVNVILDARFWQHTISIFTVIELIRKGIQSLKNTDISFSEMKHIHKELSDNVFSDIDKLVISEGEKICLQSVMKRRLDELITPAHCAANLLDPNYQGIDNNCEEHANGIDYILKLGTS